MANRIPRISRDMDDRQIAEALANAVQIQEGIVELSANSGHVLERNYKPVRPPARLSSGAVKDLENLTPSQREFARSCIEHLEATPGDSAPFHVFGKGESRNQALVIFCEQRDGIRLIYQIVYAYVK
jgi:hypothetical protein